MAASTATVNVSLQWTPPGAPLNSGNSPFSVISTYNGQNVGQIDVPSTYVPPAALAVPFGNVSVAKVLFIKNMMSVEVGVRLNGAIANNFNLPAGAEFAYISPAAPVAIPLTQVEVLPVVAPTVIESIYYFCYGD